MGLSAGTRLGSYEILSALGAGGMGEVYRARDTRLDRTVAIKVLPAAMAADPQLRDRFDREARAISSLSHPHICALFDVGHQDGVDFLVLEYLEGETLADSARPQWRSKARLAASRRAPIRDRNLRRARQGAPLGHRPSRSEAGERHADEVGREAARLRPREERRAGRGHDGLSMLPTTPPNLTAQGTILGTFQYMAPEQIEGLEADARTDIFAFGALLFEMLTGRPAFEGKTRASLLGAILKDEPPPVSTLYSPSPRRRSIGSLSTCLAKDPDDRYQSARDLAARSESVECHRSGDCGCSSPRPAYSRLAWAIAALAVLALSIVTVRHLRETPAERGRHSIHDSAAGERILRDTTRRRHRHRDASRGVTGWPERSVRRQFPEEVSAVAQATRRRCRAGHSRDRGRDLPLLVARQPLYRILCQRKAEKSFCGGRPARPALRRGSRGAAAPGIATTSSSSRLRASQGDGCAVTVASAFRRTWLRRRRLHLRRWQHMPASSSARLRT